MLKDLHGRIMNYVRISLTDKCNIRCRYCIPQKGIKSLSHNELLRFEEIYLLLKIFKELNINKFRFTGGEPFVRRNAMFFFEKLNIGKFYITTNLLSEGLDINRLNNLNIGGINISLDTLNPEKYKWITRGGDFNRVMKNIRDLQIKNIKLNAVIIKDFNEDEIKPLINFASEIGATMRFIEKMDFFKDDLDYISLDEIRKNLISENILSEEKISSQNSVSIYHQQTSGKGKVGFIMPVSKPFCNNCNRIRLSSDGAVKLCLFAKKSLNLHDMIREGKDENEIKEVLIKAVLEKLKVPENYTQTESMSAIGG